MKNSIATDALEDAHRGDAEAQCFVAIALTHGRDGFTRDKRATLKWFRLAAAQGHPDALYNLRFLHDIGDGVPEDPEEAQRPYGLAAALGYAEAFVQLEPQGTA